MKRDAAAPPACKVTMQYHSGKGFVYELDNAGAALAVHVSRAAASGDEGEWLVAVHNGRNADAAVIAESASTRSEALRRVANSWVEKSSELGLPAFDWNAVTDALLSVRAI
jgi:hypothetical protein